MNDAIKIPASTWASDVRALMDAMLLLEANQLLTYAQMEELVGRPIRGASGEYQTARNRLSRDYRVEIRTIPNVGAMRLDDHGIVEELPKDRRTVHRRVKRSIRRMSNVEDYGSLTPSQRLEYDRHGLTVALIDELQKPTIARAIDDRAARARPNIDVDKLIAVLRE